MNILIDVAVVGAGVVGLSTAVKIQESIPKARVTLISDRFGQETTSDGAAGIFRPTVGKVPGVPIPTLKKWLRDSWDRYELLARSADAGEAGVQVLSGHRFVDSPTENELEAGLVSCNRRMEAKEMAAFPEECRKYKHGWFVTTLLTEPRRYLPYLLKQFKANGGKVVQRKVSSLEELAGSYKIVVNCTGFGSQQLLGDDKLVPIRGQVFKVLAPWIKHSLHVGDAAKIYIIPGIEYITVGGTRQENDTDTKVREEDAKIIWENACKVMPSLKKAKIIRQWAGLRPHREPLRLERQTLKTPAGTIQVIHNYGHGAEGVGLSWGTACHAARLVQEALVLTFSKI
ncbi:hypothetical protein CAPTEDRAFT_19157 [Capitella teleta]|uniref:FAD dependent oxidoreductase domain-containing protein n=1 Tax=Capitella teleta TaxID=283909 RepID=R7UJH4_CAPTE|nr:hypothetical protein CAPTEDRAFT_19157 [Capitella teleta]|eukprot:ELU06258.1 hypothetical protein CAPTEDRAFT_19157 [Capitella teleta]